ncbi:MAG: hypothetical protein SFZ02_12190 [bacterium]|nr:hypothetical protein [bacterium]
MLKIVESSPTRLVLKDQRGWATLFAWLFTLISAGAWLFFVAQIIPIIESSYARDGMLWVMVVVIFFSLISALVVLGVLVTRHFGYGIHCHFDRTAETITLEHIGIFHPVKKEYSIYAIGHVDTEHNTEIGVYGVFLVMKNGERLPLASFYEVDEAEMKTVINEIRTFIRG